VAEFDWSHDGIPTRVPHAPDLEILCVSDGNRRSEGPPIFHCACGLHCHFPLWATRCGVHLLRPGRPPDKLGYLAHHPNREALKGLRRTLARVTHPVLWIGVADVPGGVIRWIGRGSIAWMSSAAFLIG